MKKFIVLILLISAVTNAQKRFLVTPNSEAIPLKSGESSIEAAQRIGLVSTTYQYPKYTTPSYPSEVIFNAGHKMLLAMWYVAPASGTLDTFYFMTGPAVGAKDSLVWMRINATIIGPSYGPGVGVYESAPPCQGWGYWRTTNDLDNGLGAFINDLSPTDDTTWYSTIQSDTNSRPLFSAELFGEPNLGVTVHPNQINRVDWAGTGLTPSLNTGDQFFISLRINSLNTHSPTDIPTTFVANVSNASTPSRNWVFYEHPSLSGEGPDGCDCGGVKPWSVGWTARGGPTGKNDGMTFNWWYTMTVTSDVAPGVVSYTKLSHTFSTAPRTLTAEIIDENPYEPDSAGVASAYLVYSVNGSPADTILMTHEGGNSWTATLPGLPGGSEVHYHIIAYDIKGNRSPGTYDGYKVYNLNTYYSLDTSYPYSWIEIDTSGTQITNWFRPPLAPPPYSNYEVESNDVGTAGPIDIGGTFKFFELDMLYAWISIDGSLCLSSEMTDTIHVEKITDLYPPSATGIPGTLSRNCIAPMSKNFILSHGGVYFKQIGDLFVVEWDSVRCRLDETDSVTTFEVILDRSDNSITFQYKDVGKYTASGSTLVGLQAEPTEKWCFVNWNGYPIETRLRKEKALKLFTNLTFQATSGWGLYSVPVNLFNKNKTEVFPSAVSPAFRYKNGYQITDTIENGLGYWLKYDSDQILHLGGTKLLTDTIDVTQGWNIIGSIYDTVDVNSVIQIPDSIILTPFYGYSTLSGYNAATSIAPGKGYWVKTKTDGKLILK